MKLPTPAPHTDIYSGVRWSAISKYGTQLFRFAVSIVLARLLAPEMFGIISMAAVVTDFAEVLTRLGFGVAVVQRRDVGRTLLSTLFWANLAVCCLLALAVIAVSPLVASAFGEPVVAPVLVALSFMLPLNALTTIQVSLLQRKMDFKRLAFRELASMIITGGTSIVLAAFGAGVWALVAGSLVGCISNAILVQTLERFRPAFRFSWPHLQSCLRFGLNLTGTNLFNYFSRNADNAIIGSFLGSRSLGFYSMAYKFVVLPRDAIARVLVRVMLPRLSQLQNDDLRLGQTYMKGCAAIAIFTFPLMAGIAVLAEPFIACFLGETWLPCSDLLQILAPVGALQSIDAMRQQIFIAKNRTSLLFHTTVAAGILTIASFFVGVAWGVHGVAMCYLIVNLIIIPVNFWLVFSIIDGMKLSQFTAAMTPIAGTTAVMSLAVMAFYHLATSLLVDKWLILGGGVIVGALVYTCGLLLLRPLGLLQILKLLRIPVLVTSVMVLTCNIRARCTHVWRQLRTSKRELQHISNEFESQK